MAKLSLTHGLDDGPDSRNPRNLTGPRNPGDPTGPELPPSAAGMVRGANGQLYPQGQDPRARKALRKRWKLAVVSLAILLAFGLVPLGGWYMLGQVPASYAAYRKQLHQTDPRDFKQAAEGIEAKVIGALLSTNSELAPTAAEVEQQTSQTSQATPATSESLAEDAGVGMVKVVDGMRVEDLGKDEMGRSLRRVEMGPEQMNAWLAGRLSDWLAYRDFEMPAEIRWPMVEVTGGKLTMFFTFESEGFSQEFQGHFDLKIDQEGLATIKLANMQAGRVPVPVNALGKLVSKAAGQVGTAQRASQWISKIQNYRFKPAMKLPDGLKAQVLKYQTQGDKIILTLRIERYRPSTRKLNVASVTHIPPPE